jgi:hypothetical protein
MGRLGLHLRKKLLIEPSPSGLCDNGSPNGRTFAERLKGWLGKWAHDFAKAKNRQIGSQSIASAFV